MLKRAWLVASLAWTALVLATLLDLPPGALVFVVSFPWLAGPLIFFSFRYILHGTLRSTLHHRRY
jgi:hypothetical protein